MNVQNMHFQRINCLIFGFSLTLSVTGEREGSGESSTFCIIFCYFDVLENYRALKFVHCGIVLIPCGLALGHQSCLNENCTEEKNTHDYVNLFHFFSQFKTPSGSNSFGFPGVFFRKHFVLNENQPCRIFCVNVLPKCHFFAK